jgi:hypothetical protein
MREEKHIFWTPPEAGPLLSLFLSPLFSFPFQPATQGVQKKRNYTMIKKIEPTR